MDIEKAEPLLRERLDRLPARTVDALLGAMSDFYRDVRFDTVPLEEDGDGLLLQWGTYDWGQGHHFEFDLTRQFLVPGRDEPFQLHLTMRFRPTAALSALGASSQWCFALESLREFEESMRSSPPYRALESSTPTAVKVRLERV